MGNSFEETTPMKKLLVSTQLAEYIRRSSLPLSTGGEGLGVRRPEQLQLLLFILLLSLSQFSCTRRVEYPSMDYMSGTPKKLPEWECHQAFSLVRDSVTKKSYLKVTAFPKKEYPGISLPWVTGDWRGYSTLRITARAHDTRDSIPFNVFLFDGRGLLTLENRFNKKFIVHTGWTICEIPLLGGLKTPGGRMLDKKHISQVVFFTGRRMEPTIFDLGIIQLR